MESSYEVTIRKIERFEKDNGKLCTKEDIVKYFKTNTPDSLNAVSKELSFIKRLTEGRLSLGVEDIRDVIDYESIYNNRFLTPKELLETIREADDNVQDVIIPVLAYHNLIGRDYSVIKTIKKSDVDLNNNTICGVKIDEIFIPYIDRAMTEDEYYTLKGNVQKLVESEYLVRACKVGKKGGGEVSSALLKTRVNKIQSATGGRFTLTTLKNSGVVYNAIISGESLQTTKEIRNFLNREKIKMNIQEFQLIKSSMEAKLEVEKCGKID